MDGLDDDYPQPMDISDDESLNVNFDWVPNQDGVFVPFGVGLDPSEFVVKNDDDCTSNIIQEPFQEAKPSVITNRKFVYAKRNGPSNNNNPYANGNHKYNDNDNDNFNNPPKSTEPFFVRLPSELAVEYRSPEENDKFPGFGFKLNGDTCTNTHTHTHTHNYSNINTNSGSLLDKWISK